MCIGPHALDPEPDPAGSSSADGFNRTETDLPRSRDGLARVLGRWRSTRRSRSPCPRWAIRLPKARSWSGTSRRVTPSRPTRRSSRSRPTRSTPRSPHRPRARSSRSTPPRATRSRSARCSPRSRPTARRRDRRGGRLRRGRRARHAARGRGGGGGPATEGNGSGAGGRRPRPAPAQTIDIVTPPGGESVTEGTILEWAKKPATPSRRTRPIVEISTDKVDMELPAPASGHDRPRSSPQEGETVTRRPGDRAA